MAWHDVCVIIKALSYLLHFADSRWPRVDTDKVSQLVHPTLVSYVSFRRLSILEVDRCAPWCGTWRSVTMPTYCIFMRLWWVTFWVEFHLERQSRVMYLMWGAGGPVTPLLHVRAIFLCHVLMSIDLAHLGCKVGLANLGKLFESLLSHHIDVDSWLLQFTVFAGCSL